MNEKASSSICRVVRPAASSPSRTAANTTLDADKHIWISV